MLSVSALLKLLNAKLNVLSWCRNYKTDVKNVVTVFMLSFTCLSNFMLIKDDVETVFTAVIAEEFMIQKTLIERKKININ